MRDTNQEIVIGDQRFTIQMLPSMRALRLLGQVAEALAPAIAKATGEGMAQAVGKLADGKSKASDLLDLDIGGLVSGIADGVSVLFQKLTPEMTQQVTLDLLSTCNVILVDEQGEKSVPLVQPSNRGSGFGQIDLIFRGRMLDLMRLIGFAWSVNYGDFSDALSALKDRAQRVRAAKKIPSDSKE